MSLLKENFDWVKGHLDEWKLTTQEQALLIGEGTACSIDLIAKDPEKATQFQKRLDNVAIIIEDLLSAKITPPDPEYAANWFRTAKNFPFWDGNISPLDHIQNNGEAGIEEIAGYLMNPK